MKGSFNKTIFDISFLYHNNFIGLLLIIVGIIFLFNPTNLHFKVSAALILIGILIIIFFDLNDKSIPKSIDGKQLTVVITLWIIFSFIITTNIDADFSLTIVILGILTLKEFLSDFISFPLKKRINFLYYSLIIVFIIIIGQKVINIIGI